MDWKQFISSIVGSIAWPVVVFVLLFVLRKQLSAPAGRLIKLSLPGGVEASFGEGLEEARKKAEQILLETPEKRVATVGPPSDETKQFELAQHFPEAAVLEAFKEIEDLILQIRDYMPEVKDAKNLGRYVQELNYRQLIDGNTVRLFDFLRNLRNIAAHGGGGVRISPGEAVEYQTQCEVLFDKLEMALDALEHKSRGAGME